MKSLGKAAWLAGLLAVYAFAAGAGVAAQTLPSEPIVLADGHITLGGDISASIAPEDPGFYNYTDYEHSALRLLRIDVTAMVKAGGHLAVLGEGPSQKVERPQP